MSAPQQSPSLLAPASSETKFLLDEEQARRLREWAQATLVTDQHADPRTGSYEVTTLYLDTPERDVFRQREPHASRKYRIRRYGSSSLLHLERKMKRGGRVRKIRWAAEEFAGEAGQGESAYWFARRVRLNRLEPAAVVSYSRAAFFGASAGTVFRLTLDHDLRIADPVAGWSLVMPEDAEEFLAGQRILEVKYVGSIPAPVRQWIGEFGLRPLPISKYRTGMRQHVA